VKGHEAHENHHLEFAFRCSNRSSDNGFWQILEGQLLEAAEIGALFGFFSGLFAGIVKAIDKAEWWRALIVFLQITFIGAAVGFFMGIFFGISTGITMPAMSAGTVTTLVQHLQRTEAFLRATLIAGKVGAIVGGNCP